MTTTLLDAQTTIELPTREMLGFNFAAVFASQQAGNSSTQLNLVGLYQLNGAGQDADNAIVVIQD